MEKITSTAALEAAILELTRQKSLTRNELESELIELRESLSASNILKGTLENFGGSGELKTKAASSVIGLGSGWLAQKLFAGHSKSLVKNIAGKVFQFAVTGLVAKNSGGLIKKAIGLLRNKTT